MEYDLSKEEPDYLKFFYPSCKWDELMEADTAKEQADLWRQYFECVLLGLAAALKTTEKVERKKTEVRLKENSVVKAEKLFAFTIQDLNNIYRMTKEFTDALQETGQQEYSTVIHKKAADRYGIYSAGARLFAHGSSSGKNLYLWCGLLFTDKKKSGLIIEADRYSNQDTFDVLLKNIPESAGYEVERSNGFIKLFLPEKAFRAIKEAKEKLAAVVLEEIYDVMSQNQPFDEERFERALDDMVQRCIDYEDDSGLPSGWDEIADLIDEGWEYAENQDSLSQSHVRHFFSPV